MLLSPDCKRSAYGAYVVFFLLVSVPDLYAQQESKNVSLESMDKTDGGFRRQLDNIITEKEEAKELGQAVDAYIRYAPGRKAKSQAGKLSLIDAQAEYSYAFKLFGQLPIELNLDQQEISLDNTTVVKLPAHLIGLSAGVEATLPFFFDKTYLRLALNPSFFADSWVFHTSSFRMPVQSFVIYQPDVKWTFIAGVAVSMDFENEVLPILGFIYKPNERLTFNIIPRRPDISYRLNNKVTLFAEGDMVAGEFEVSQDNRRGVVLDYNEIHLGGGIRYKVNKFIQTSLSAGGMFNRSIKYRQDSLGKVSIKNGLYTEFRAEIAI